MRVRPSLLAACLGLLCLQGCSTPPPRHVAEARHATLRADDPALLPVFAEVVDTWLPRVAATLPGTRVDRPEIRLRSDPAFFESDDDGQTRGKTLVETSVIEIDGTLPPLGRSFITIHELVHFLLDESWHTLPLWLEEGLAHSVSVALVPQTRFVQSQVYTTEAIRAFAAIHAPRSMQVQMGAAGGDDGLATFTVDVGTERVPLPAGPIEYLKSIQFARPAQKLAGVTAAVRGLAFVIVERIRASGGYEAVRALSTRAMDEGLDVVPLEWILEAADLTADTDWLQLLLDQMSPRDWSGLPYRMRMESSGNSIRFIQLDADGIFELAERAATLPPARAELRGDTIYVTEIDEHDDASAGDETP